MSAHTSIIFAARYVAALTFPGDTRYGPAPGTPLTVAVVANASVRVAPEQPPANENANPNKAERV